MLRVRSYVGIRAEVAWPSTSRTGLLHNLGLHPPRSGDGEDVDGKQAVGRRSVDVLQQPSLLRGGLDLGSAVAFLSRSSRSCLVNSS